MTVNAEVLFGAFLIVIYALERFNTPSTIRASTTAGRYYVASFVYLLIYLATFYIFTKYPHLLNHFRVDPALAESSPIDPGNSTPVFVAMLLSLLVPKVPLISQLDARLLKFLHRLAAIPYEAIRLSQEIQQTDYQIPAAMRTALASELEEQGFNPDEIDLDASDLVIQKWNNITALILQLREWEKASQFTTFVQDRSGQYQRIKEHYKRLTTMAQNAFVLHRQADEQPELEALQDAVNKFRINLLNEEKAIFSEICDFISHGILKTCFRFGSRTNILEKMGFQNLECNRGLGLSVNHTISLFGLLLALVLVNFIMFRPPNADVERILLMITMIVSIYSAAVICAVFPKQHWAFFQYNDTSYYPGLGYVISGLLAVIASLGISLCFKTLIFAGDPAVNGLTTPFTMAWQDFSTNSYPWLIMSFVTAVSTAFLIDWRHPRWLKAKWQRVTEAGTQAALLVTAVMLVHWWLSGLSTNEYFSGRVPDLGSVIRVSAIIGLVLGYFVPTWYRTTTDKDLAAAPHTQSDNSNIDITEASPTHSAVITRLHDAS